MKISTRGRYGVRAMFELAKHHGSYPLSAKEISRIQDIPPAYLEQILNKLQKAHLVRGIRGTGGGFLLGHRPEHICIMDIIRVLEKSVSSVECVSETTANGYCPRLSSCIVHLVWKKLDQATRAVLESMSLADLCELEKQPAHYVHQQSVPSLSRMFSRGGDT